MQNRKNRKKLISQIGHDQRTSKEKPLYRCFAKVLFLGTPILVLSIFLLSAQCSLDLLEDGEITLVSYNVENLFNAQWEGTEYDEFHPAAGEWTERHYQAKLRKTAEVLEKAVPGGADILLLQEAENLGVVQVLVDEYLGGLGYREIICQEAEASAVNTALVSRFPVVELATHRVQPPLSEEGSEKGGRLRFILEAVVDTGNGHIRIFNNHWKSKSGGAEETEYLRRAAADLVVRRLARLNRLTREKGDARGGAGEDRGGSISPECPVVLGGDLNASFEEWGRVAYPTALVPWPSDYRADHGGNGGGELLPLLASTDRDSVRDAAASGEETGEGRSPVLFNPWDTQDFPGSYAFRGDWERIDNFLLSSALLDGVGLEFSSFEVYKAPFLLTSSGYPKGWRTEDMSGYSDHLPLVLRLEVF